MIVEFQVGIIKYEFVACEDGDNLVLVKGRCRYGAGAIYLYPKWVIPHL
jgi:hypothetical protein